MAEPLLACQVIHGRPLRIGTDASLPNFVLSLKAVICYSNRLKPVKLLI
jgi:hypothetical protein